MNDSGGGMVSVERRATGRGGVRRLGEARGIFCLHCRQFRAHEARGLCRSCYSRPAVRELYPLPDSIISRRKSAGASLAARRVLEERGEWESGGSNLGRPLPKEPTAALPGSLEKLGVMEERHGRGEQLHHPADVTWETMGDGEGA